jgi:hypothetical protein
VMRSTKSLNCTHFAHMHGNEEQMPKQQPQFVRPTCAGFEATKTANTCPV